MKLLVHQVSPQSLGQNFGQVKQRLTQTLPALHEGVEVRLVGRSHHHCLGVTIKLKLAGWGTLHKVPGNGSVKVLCRAADQILPGYNMHEQLQPHVVDQDNRSPQPANYSSTYVSLFQALYSPSRTDAAMCCTTTRPPDP